MQSRWTCPAHAHFLWKTKEALVPNCILTSFSCVCVFLCTSLLTATHYVWLLLLQLGHHSGAANRGKYTTVHYCSDTSTPLYCVTGMSFGFLFRHIGTTLYTYKWRRNKHITSLSNNSSFPWDVWQPRATAKAMRNSFISASGLLCSVDISQGLHHALNVFLIQVPPSTESTVLWTGYLKKDRAKIVGKKVLLQESPALPSFEIPMLSQYMWYPSCKKAG